MLCDFIYLCNICQCISNTHRCKRKRKMVHLLIKQINVSWFNFRCKFSAVKVKIMLGVYVWLQNTLKLDSTSMRRRPFFCPEKVAGVARVEETRGLLPGVRYNINELDDKINRHPYYSYRGETGCIFILPSTEFQKSMTHNFRSFPKIFPMRKD